MGVNRLPWAHSGEFYVTLLMRLAERLMAHKVYSAIVMAIRSDKLSEPFGEKEFRAACPSLGEGTYRAFLHKHTSGNTAGDTELFERVMPGRFRCIRPLRYGL